MQVSDAVLTVRGQAKSGSSLKAAAREAGVPIYAMKTCSSSHLKAALRTLLALDPSPGGVFTPGGIFPGGSGFSSQDSMEEVSDPTDSGELR